MRTLSSLEVVVSGYNSPEGPAFDRDGNLFFVNWLTSSIVRVTPDGAASEFANTGGIPAGLAFHRDGTLYVADEGEHLHGVLRVAPDGRIAPWVQEFEGRPLNGANDLVFDQNGILYFSDPWGSSLERPIGAVYRAFPDGRLEQIDRGLAFPNGVAINADGTAVFLAETLKNHILRYELLPDGRVGQRRIFARLSGSPGPDGMAFDADGHLYVAHWGEGRVDVFDPSGAEVGRIETLGRNTTNVAFGGPDRQTLVITEVETASVYRVRLDVPGQPQFVERPL
ncbi:MAG: SMP-30/gluconolactonase/LRE family protein [Chloroflexi bacterium]|nr:SMP-30/gluconolactonase/LRE family protein [Chloroflexota bacterium]